MTGWEVAAVSAIVLGAATVTALAGFGFALLAVPLLAVVLGARAAIPVSTALGILSSTVQLVHLRHHVDRPTATRQLAAAAVGMPIGLAVLLAVDERVLLGAIAVTVLIAVVLLVRGLHLPDAGPRLDLGAGFVSGLLNTSVGTAGPPLVLAGQARGVDPMTFRATLAAVFAGSNLVAVPLFVAGGRVTSDVLTAAAIALPALAVGWGIGVSLHHRVAPEPFRRLVLGLLVVSALVAGRGALA